MIRVGMLSGWHVHAKGYANELRKIPEAKITAVWDEDAKRGEPWATELDVPFVANLDAFLKRDDIDAVVCDAPTNRHEEVMVAAAQAGKHIFTEKVMALTVKECNGIADAVRKAGVQFCISFPARTRPNFLFAKKVADEKLIGEVTLLRVRVAHDGASGGWLPPHFWDPVACGGGAMMDLGAHPMYLARWILGKPKTIASTFSCFTNHPLEDNAVCTIEFENKAIAVVETSFVSTHSPDCLELHGTEGCVYAGGPNDGVWFQTDHESAKTSGWTCPTLPEEQPRPVVQFIKALADKTPMPFNLDDGTNLTELMEYAYIAHRAGKTVEIPAR